METLLAPTPSSATIRQQTASARLLSVDVLRGLCVAGMVLVNFPADWVLRYHQLGHAEWDGATATDMIFPMFLFLAGFSMVYSFASRTRRGETRATLASHVVMRSLILLFLGLALNAFPTFNWHMLHIPGVLQRIALCYLVGGLFTLSTANRQSLQNLTDPRFKINSAALIALAIAILVGVWMLVRFVSVPGFGPWRFDHDGNLGAIIDRAIFGNQHLSDWGGPSRMWDADGLLGCITSIPNLLLGVLVAGWLRKQGEGPAVRSNQKTLLPMALTAILLVAAGLALNPYLVINRKLWTDSFTLLSSGVSLGLFTIFLLVLDRSPAFFRVPRWRWALTPALVYGSNAILGFAIFTVLWDLIGIIRLPGSHAPANWMPGPVYAALSNWFNPYNASLIWSLFMVLVVCAILWPLYRRRIFLRL